VGDAVHWRLGDDNRQDHDVPDDGGDEDERVGQRVDDHHVPGLLQ
jgi:hypothetical protein